MTKRTIKLEFEFAARRIVQKQNGLEAIEYSVRPTSELDFWNDVFAGKDITQLRPCMKSAASCTEEESLEVIALQHHDTIVNFAAITGAEVEPCKTAHFKGADGQVRTINIPKVTLH